MAQANTTAEINLAVKLLSRLNKLELTAIAVWGSLLQVTETQVLRFTLTLSKLSLQRVHNNSRKPSGLLIVDEDVELADSKQNWDSAVCTKRDTRVQPRVSASKPDARV